MVLGDEGREQRSLPLEHRDEVSESNDVRVMRGGNKEVYRFNNAMRLVGVMM